MKASPAVVVCCLNADQIFKCVPAFLESHYGNWIRKLTREDDRGLHKGIGSDLFTGTGNARQCKLLCPFQILAVRVGHRMVKVSDKAVHLRVFSAVRMFSYFWRTCMGIFPWQRQQPRYRQLLLIQALTFFR